MPVTIRVEHLGSKRFRFVSSDMSMDEAKKLDRLLSGNGYSLERMTSTKKKIEKESPSASKLKLRDFYRHAGVLK